MCWFDYILGECDTFPGESKILTSCVAVDMLYQSINMVSIGYSSDYVEQKSLISMFCILGLFYVLF